jgi:hypothetical protein
LSVVETPRTVASANNLEKLVQLQKILFEEEKTAYMNSLKPHHGYLRIIFDSNPILRDTKVHPLVHVHSIAVYQKSLTRLLELAAFPLLFNLQQKHKENQERVSDLNCKTQ